MPRYNLEYIRPTGKMKRNYIKSIDIPIGKRKIVKNKNGYNMVYPNFNSAFRIQVSHFKDGMPSVDLLEKPKLVDCNQDSKNVISVDISDEKIEFAEKGLFISIEMIGEIDSDGQIINKQNSLPSFMFTNKSSKGLASEQYYKSIFTDGWKDYPSEELKTKKNYKLAVSFVLNMFDD